MTAGDSTDGQGSGSGPQPGRRDFEHTAFTGSDRGVALQRAKLTDQQRVGVLLQGAALLSHAQLAGAWLRRGWDGARVDRRGVLRLEAPVPGRPSEMAQVALLDLLERLFQKVGPPAGRGEARRVARHLHDQLSQVLTPVPPDRVVEEILESAQFLWSPAFGIVRRALAAEHRRGDERTLWVAGSGGARRRFLALGAGDFETLGDHLAAPEAHHHWQGESEDGGPGDAAERRSWRRELVRWRRATAAGEGTELELAGALVAVGRYRSALEALAGQDESAARILRTRCQLRLGELRGAMATLRELARRPLDGDQRLELAGLVSRVLAARGRQGEIGQWMERLLDPTEVDDWSRELVLAGAAWDRGDLKAAERGLRRSREGALQDPHWAGRWHHLKGQLALMVRDGVGAAESIARALSESRRELPPARAARLWSDLAVARAYAGDLAGAEHACRHAERLLWGAEGPVRTTLVLYNLAEVRLRRGRVEGVEAILERSTAENRRSGNRKALIRDLELWVRLELAQGRPAAALTRCLEARRELADGDPENRRGVFEVFAARAHGWLGRTQRAAIGLDRSHPDDLAELESEERPALLALAGRLDEATGEAAHGPWRELWAALAAAIEPESGAWDSLDTLEPYRAARLVFDCETLRPGVVPPQRLRSAVVVLRQAGAEWLAERLESKSLGPWTALERYAETAAAGGPTVESSEAGLASIRTLLEGAGYHDVRLSWERAGDRRVLLAGEGGSEILEGAWGGGSLVLESPLMDPVLSALFALLRRDLRPPRMEGGDRRSAAAGDGGIVGRSQVMVQLLDRLDRLAASELPVLVLGESGTGKELAARRVHDQSARAPKPYLPVNCAAFAESLIQSDLFGAVRGAYTGADRDRIGYFESARGGTVFLDEIGDLPASAQGKLLRVLQEGEIRRLGESVARKVDVRVVAATHRDLAAMVDEGTFRQDLYFRLKVATVELPPLRDRGRDVLEIAEHHLEEKRRLAPNLRLTSEAEGLLLAHTWPGNVRELINVLDLGATLASDGQIGPEILELGAPTPAATEVLGDYHQKVEDFRKGLLVAALKQSGNNQAEAARLLGLTRQALSYLVRKFGLL